MKAFFLGGLEPGEQEVRETLKGFFKSINCIACTMSHNQLISTYYRVLRSVFTGLENMEDKA